MTSQLFKLEQLERELHRLQGAMLGLADVCKALIEIGGQTAVEAAAKQHEETVIYTLNSPLNERVLDAHADMADMVGFQGYLL